ncbi:hypothetical protein [Streptomyces sp. NPDC006270]|uniref:hypothetical protein n=1 Tax=Streptomyces sp. NPDC006270 TaxID=3364741 RepID=UPI00368221A8
MAVWAGRVHRDLKPSNVLLTVDGVRVIDIGIARAVDHATSVTHAGAFIGSPAWPPDVCCPVVPVARSDAGGRAAGILPQVASPLPRHSRRMPSTPRSWAGRASPMSCAA